MNRMTPMINNPLSLHCFCRTGWQKLILVVLIVGASNQLSAEQTYSRQVQRVLYNAQQAQKENQLEKAIGILQTYLADNPEKPPVVVYTFLGSLYHQTDSLQQAQKAFEQGFALDPQNFMLCRNLAVIAYQLKQLRRAASLFEKAYQLNGKKQPDLLYQAASFHYLEKQFNETVRIAQGFIGTHASAKKRWFTLIVYAHLENKNKVAAEKVILSYLKRHPGEGRFWEILSGIRLEKGDYLQGAAALEILYQLLPPKDEAWIELADIYLFLNAPLKAVFCYQKVQTKDSVKVLEKMATAYRAIHQYDKASDLLARALAITPTADGYQKRGRFFFDEGAYQESIASFSKSLELNPDQGETYLLLGNAAMELKDWKRAREAFNKAINDEFSQSQAMASLRIIDTLQTAQHEAERSAEDL